MMKITILFYHKLTTFTTKGDYKLNNLRLFYG